MFYQLHFLPDGAAMLREKTKPIHMKKGTFVVLHFKQYFM